jgi:DNA helicase-2/ATP-dependent DNA helicase PcrA
MDLWISTFHSFCERILKDQGLDIGLPTNFKILDQAAAWLLLRQNIDKLNLDYYKPLGNPTKFIQALLSHFSHCKDQGIEPEHYLEYADTLKIRDDAPEESKTQRIFEIARAYHVYQRLLLENNSLDFGDLINYCLKLFQKRPLILKKYREKFKYILVDEFQDTNWAQYELIKILAVPKNNLTVTADDDQAIYKFRGASFNNIIQFKKDFPDVKQISLIRNYRSLQNILDLAYKFIKANDPDRLEYVNKINKKLLAQKSGAGIIKHIHASTLNQEISETINKILKILKKDKKASYSDFAILVRANDAATPFIKEIKRVGIPYQFLSSRGLYSQPCILDIISYFKLLDNYHESPAVYRILNLPFLKIPYEDIVKLTQYSHKKTNSLYETIQELPLIPGISSMARGKIIFISDLIKKHSLLIKEKMVSELLVSFLQDSGYLKYLAEMDEKTFQHSAEYWNVFCRGGGDKEQIDLLNQFYKRVKKFEENTIEPTLKNFVEEINLELESGEEGKMDFDPEQGPDMVKITTIHGAKGLEFKYVFIVNMVDKRFPTIARGEAIELPEDLIKDIKPTGDIHLQEERRLCYVAMTRAKKELYFTSGQDYGGVIKKKLSRFLLEMGYQNKFEIRNPKSETNSKLKILNSKHKITTKAKSSEQKYLPKHFSFSQLVAFEKCPLQYKFNFILKIPVKGKGSFSFGKTMHTVLCDFLRYAQEVGKNQQENLFGFKESQAIPQISDKISHNKSEKEKNILSFDLLKEIYEKKWLDEWYENKIQKEEYYKLGKKIIKDFYEDFLKNQPKILKINDNIALEIPFNLKIGEHTLRGQIDRIDETNEGVEVLDYKTGVAKDKLLPEDKEQLLIYQLAAEEVFKLNPQKLTYYYLNKGEKKSFLGTEKEKTKIKEKILAEIEKIKISDFKPTPSRQCAFCDFKNICDFAER